MVGGPSAEPKDESSDDDYAGIRGFVGPSDGKAFPIRVQSSSWKNASGSEKQEWWDFVEEKKPQHLELDFKVLPDNEWKMERRRSKELKAAKERERERAAASRPDSILRETRGDTRAVFVRQSSTDDETVRVVLSAAQRAKDRGEMSIISICTDEEFELQRKQRSDSVCELALPEDQQDLMPALKMNDAKKLRELLRGHPNRTPCSESLVIACALGASDCAGILLDFGVPTDVPGQWRDCDGDCALNFALKASKKKGQFTTHDSVTLTPSERRVGARKCAKMILEHHRKLDSAGFSAKHAEDLWAEVGWKYVHGDGDDDDVDVDHDMLDAVKLLLDARVDPNVPARNAVQHGMPKHASLPLVLYVSGSNTCCSSATLPRLTCMPTRRAGRACARPRSRCWTLCLRPVPTRRPRCRLCKSTRAPSRSSPADRASGVASLTSCVPRGQQRTFANARTRPSRAPGTTARTMAARSTCARPSTRSLTRQRSNGTS